MGRGPDVVRHLRDPRLRQRWIVVGVCGALTTVPLVGTLGYESGFVLAPLAALLGMAVGVDVVHARRGAGRPVTVGGLATDAGGRLSVLAGLALGIFTLGRLWQRGCDPLGGLAFFAMGPVAAAILGWGCGIWAGVLVPRRRRALMLAFVPMAVCIGIGLHRLYADPVVFAYDPFFGYFSGSVYDEAVAVDRRYLTYRGYCALGLGAALAAFALVIDPRGRPGRPPAGLRSAALGVLTVLAAAGTAAIGLKATRFHFTADTESIAHVLSGTRETEHFVIHYAPRSPEARSIDAVAKEHEFAWHRLHAIMGRAPEGRIESFVFVDPEQKRALMGAGTVQVAAPWRRQIYLDHRPFPHPVLHHELAHVFAGTIGDPVFGVSLDGLHLNIGLVEGLATALAPRANDRLDLHDQAEVLRELGHRPPLAEIMGPGFFTRSSRVAYITAGSFCLWLIQTRGFEPMAILYRTAGDFELAYGTSLSDLETQWLAFLDAREGPSPEDVQAQAEHFRRPAVWQRPCAHRVAAVAREIGQANAAVRLDDAIDGYRDLCALEPESPGHRIGLATGLARAGELTAAVEVLDEVAAMPDLTVTIERIIHERRGDIALQAGRGAVAAAAYAAADALPGSEDQHRVLLLKAVAAGDPELAPLVLDYFAPFETTDDPVVRAMARLFDAQRIAGLRGRHALGRYLLARQLLLIQRPAEAIAPLRDSLLPGPDGAIALPDDAFVRAAREALMTAAVEAGDFDTAWATLAELQGEPGLDHGHRLEYDLWAERIAFFAGDD